MNEEIHEGLMKEGSLSAKIYFLLLDKPLTQSDISKRLYQGKVQLANIRKNLDDLEREGYVKQVGREIGKGKNYNKLYYESTLKPLLDFTIKEVKNRTKSSKSRRKGVSSKEINFLKVFLTSKWFKRFYSQKFLNLNMECEGKINLRKCSCPIRFYSRLIEEIFVITESFGVFNKGLNNYETSIDNFDKYVKDKKGHITVEYKEFVRSVLNTAKKILGNYPRTNEVLNFYFKDYGVLLLPYSLSTRLSTLGRIPLTVNKAFILSLKDNLNRKVYK